MPISRLQYALSNLNIRSIARCCKYAVLLGFASISTAFADECPPAPDDATVVCYAGILPSFIQDPIARKISFVSFALKGRRLSGGRCEVDYVVFDLDDIAARHVKKLREKFLAKWDKWDCSAARVFAEPVKITENDELKRIRNAVNLDRVASPSLDIKYHNTNIAILNLTKDAVFYLENRSAENEFISEFPLTESRKTIRRYSQTGKPKDIGPTIQYRLGVPLFLSSNGCWMVVPRSRLDDMVHPKTPLEKTQELYVFSLGERPLGEPCTEPGYREPQGKNIGTSLDLLKLDCPPRCLSIENATEIGADYAAFSPLDSPDEFHVVHQIGFDSNSHEEKNLIGDLKYTIFRRNPVKGDPKVDIDSSSKNITVSCMSEDYPEFGFSGWEFSPQFSRDKTRLFFLAMENEGDDKSKANLYVLDVENGILNADYEIETNFNCAENLVDLTGDFEEFRGKKFDYPILSYALSADMKQLRLIFEERGESVVRFFKYDKRKKKIIYEYPESISGVGKVYDIASVGLLDGGLDFPVYYILHSHLNYPISISRCYLTEFRFVCGDRFSPIQTTSIGNDISNSRTKWFGSKERTDSVVTIKREPVRSKADPERMIDVFILKPSKSNRRAFVSVHGGPNEAWDGRFSPRDYKLAELGYTIYMPNPLGSTGYGFELTDAGDNNWGKAIYLDIVDVIDHVYDKKNKEYDYIYLMGFSFGGYIVNWIQTERQGLVRNKLDALVAVSALFDLRDFASTTDQLWFPNHHLKCADVLQKLSNECLSIECDLIPSEDYPVLLDQNPACYTRDELGNDSNLNIKSPPTLFISGDFDQRIRFHYNVPRMLKAYRESCARYTMEVEKRSWHDFPGHRSAEQAYMIDRWIHDVESCGDDLKCKYELDPAGNHKQNPYFARRDFNFVFDNPVCYDHVSLKLLNGSDCSEGHGSLNLTCKNI